MSNLVVNLTGIPSEDLEKMKEKIEIEFFKRSRTNSSKNSATKAKFVANKKQGEDTPESRPTMHVGAFENLLTVKEITAEGILPGTVKEITAEGTLPPFKKATQPKKAVIPLVTKDQVKAALSAYIIKNNSVDIASELLKKFGANRLSDLKPESYYEFHQILIN